MKTTLPDPNRAEIIRVTILEKLGACRPMPLPESTLCVECKGALAAGVTQAEFSSVLEGVVADGFVTASPHPIFVSRKIYHLTALGVAALNQ